MNWETAFQAASTLAFVGWVLLAAAPRSARVLGILRYGIVGLICAAYALLVALYLGRVEGGGFMSLAGVKALMSSDPVILAGWLHYLAFDLMAGLWIASKADEMGLSRIAQVPFLFLTLMLGPVGLLAFYGVVAAKSRAAR
ncbi:MAG: hypothetical protein CTY20_10805 [Hyphomicrobium sp.]|nr:MAG: hypothetical protein CTY20_10805 [Hyphomicrobium sp.]